MDEIWVEIEVVKGHEEVTSYRGRLEGPAFEKWVRGEELATMVLHDVYWVSSEWDKDGRRFVSATIPGYTERFINFVGDLYIKTMDIVVIMPMKDGLEREQLVAMIEKTDTLHH